MKVSHLNKSACLSVFLFTSFCTCPNNTNMIFSTFLMNELFSGESLVVISVVSLSVYDSVCMLLFYGIHHIYSLNNKSVVMRDLKHQTVTWD